MTYTFKPRHGLTYTFDVDENLSGSLVITPGNRTIMFLDGKVSGAVALERRDGREIPHTFPATVVLVDKFWTTAWFSEEHINEQLQQNGKHHQGPPVQPAQS